MQNGKGDSPRNNSSKRFRDNYDSIDWGTNHLLKKLIEARDEVLKSFPELSIPPAKEELDRQKKVFPPEFFKEQT